MTKTSEILARVWVGLLILAPILVLLIPALQRANRPDERVIEIHGKIPEEGGFIPSDLTIPAGERVTFRLISDDVMHGFAIGQGDIPATDMEPGKFSQVSVTFDRPGKYTYYCTRWCGPNHWRMRGTIEVTSSSPSVTQEQTPLYISLGLNIDTPHPSLVIPEQMPSAFQASQLGLIPDSSYLLRDYYRQHSPAQTWQSLRNEPAFVDLSDAQVWDLVALVWYSNTTPESLQEGKRLYSENCAACHGETGAGDGVMAYAEPEQLAGASATQLTKPVDFTDASQMLGASPALLQGKILRGGMGTGMPYWGPIFTEKQIWDIVAFLWTFQFQP